MKCKELMVGDLINNLYGVQMRIVKVYDGYAYAAPMNSRRTTWRFDDECEHPVPIPFTPEILKKNGFDSETFLTAEWEKEVYFKEFPGCVVESDNSGKYIFGTTIYWNKTDGDGSPIDWGTMYNSRIYNLQYVHELQHSLRLCGFNELADNFKV